MTLLSCQFLYGKHKIDSAVKNILCKFVFFVTLLRYPFNWRNPITYFVAISYQYYTAIYLFRFVACLISFGLGIFLFAISATNDIKNDLKLMNDKAKTKRNRVRILKCLSSFVQFHSAVKKLSNRTH